MSKWTSSLSIWMALLASRITRRKTIAFSSSKFFSRRILPTTLFFWRTNDSLLPRTPDSIRIASKSRIFHYFHHFVYCVFVTSHGIPWEKKEYFLLFLNIFTVFIHHITLSKFLYNISVGRIFPKISTYFSILINISKVITNTNNVDIY